MNEQTKLDCVGGDTCKVSLPTAQPLDEKRGVPIALINQIVSMQERINRLEDALTKALKWRENEIRSEYEGTSLLDGRLMELQFIRDLL